ncbi:MAG: hypothetical protein ACFFD4_33750 [Candidatus Odinarchaeota archaeon]
MNRILSEIRVEGLKALNIPLLLLPVVLIIDMSFFFVFTSYSVLIPSIVWLLYLILVFPINQNQRHENDEAIDVLRTSRMSESPNAGENFGVLQRDYSGDQVISIPVSENKSSILSLLSEKAKVEVTLDENTDNFKSDGLTEIDEHLINENLDSKEDEEIDIEETLANFKEQYQIDSREPSIDIKSANELKIEQKTPKIIEKKEEQITSSDTSTSADKIEQLSVENENENEKKTVTDTKIKSVNVLTTTDGSSLQEKVKNAELFHVSISADSLDTGRHDFMIKKERLPLKKSG